MSKRRRVHAAANAKKRTVCGKDVERVAHTAMLTSVTCPECDSALDAFEREHRCHSCNGSTECSACEGCAEDDNGDPCEACADCGAGPGNCPDCNATGLSTEDGEFSSVLSMFYAERDE